MFSDLTIARPEMLEGSRIKVKSNDLLMTVDKACKKMQKRCTLTLHGQHPSQHLKPIRMIS
jgi:hypothetical protein